MSEDIYTQFGIDKSKLKRDYITYPLKRGEIPFKEDIEYLYIELNIVKTNLPLIFQSNLYVIDKALSHYKIKKPRNLIYFHYINTCMSKYGVKYYSQTKECRKKVKQTLKERYGNENYVNVEKYKENCLKKYGVPTTALLPNVIKKSKKHA